MYVQSSSSEDDVINLRMVTTRDSRRKRLRPKKDESTITKFMKRKIKTPTCPIKPISFDSSSSSENEVEVAGLAFPESKDDPPAVIPKDTYFDENWLDGIICKKEKSEEKDPVLQLVACITSGKPLVASAENVEYFPIVHQEHLDIAKKSLQESQKVDSSLSTTQLVEEMRKRGAKLTPEDVSLMEMTLISSLSQLKKASSEYDAVIEGLKEMASSGALKRGSTQHMIMRNRITSLIDVLAIGRQKS